MKWRVGLLICSLFFVVSTTSCSTGEPTPLPVKVRVERMKEARGFVVKYTTSEKVKALVFTRGSFRKDIWRVSNDSVHGQFRLERRMGVDIIEAEEPKTEFELIVPEVSTEISGDYSFISRFNDGGVVLYSGYFDVTPLHCFDDCRDPDIAARPVVASPIELILAPRSDEKVITTFNHRRAGSQIVGEVLRHQAPPEGVLVYFGKQKIMKGRGFYFIPDQEIPTWVVDELNEVLNKIIKLHSLKLARPLKEEPLIFLPHLSEFEISRSSHSGAVIGNQILLSLIGSGWYLGSPESRFNFRKLLAHEAFHLWNASLYKSSSGIDGRWLHEGSAEAFGHLSLMELGLITRDEFLALQDESLNRCMIGLGDAGLAESDEANELRNHYDCGSVIQSLLHFSLEDAGADLWTLWQTVFEIADNNDSKYDQKAFLNLARIETDNAPLMKKLQKLINSRIEKWADTKEIENFFVETYKAAGMKFLFVDSEWPSWYQNFLGERAVSAAAISDCGSKAGLAFAENGIRLLFASVCHHLEEDTEVSSVGGYSLLEDGVRAYDFIKRQCGARGETAFIEFSGDDGRSARLTCPFLPERPRYARHSL